eukprot:m.225402 g.225402  ORF g.225402 m.225402 type:complete len:54 (-) comp11258_c0_seq1:23-184(-)
MFAIALELRRPYLSPLRLLADDAACVQPGSPDCIFARLPYVFIQRPHPQYMQL